MTYFLTSTTYYIAPKLYFIHRGIHGSMTKKLKQSHGNYQELLCLEVRLAFVLIAHHKKTKKQCKRHLLTKD